MKSDQATEIPTVIPVGATQPPRIVIDHQKAEIRIEGNEQTIRLSAMEQLIRFLTRGFTDDQNHGATLYGQTNGTDTERMTLFAIAETLTLIAGHQGGTPAPFQVDVDATNGVHADSWHNCALVNGWITLSGYQPLQYRWTPEKNVQLRGIVTGGTRTDGTIVTTLPTGYRPPARLVMPAVYRSGGSLENGFADIGTDGTVRIQGCNATGSMASGFGLCGEFATTL